MAYEFSGGNLNFLISDEGAQAPSPKYLARWPKEESFLDEEKKIKSEYLFGLDQYQNLSFLQAWMSIKDVDLLLAAQALDTVNQLGPYEGSTALLRAHADRLSEIFNTASGTITSVVGKALTEASNGFAEGASALQEVSAEILEWNPMPIEIRNAIGAYAEDWADVFFEASFRYKGISEKFADIQKWMMTVYNLEVRIREKIDELQQARIQELEAYIARLEEWSADLRNFNKQFDKLVLEGRKLSKQVIDSAREVAEGPIGSMAKWIAIGIGGLVVLKFMR